MKLYRQGDVYLVPVNAVHTNRTVLKDYVLAHGEVTGHKHQVAVADRVGCELYQCGDKMFLSVNQDGGISIVHEEHKAVQIPVGDYEVRIQREYTPEEIRNVAD